MPNTLIKVVVEKTSTKYEPSFLAKGVWYITDRKDKVDLTPIKEGDEVEIDANQKWVKAFEVLTSGNAVPEGTPAPHKGGYAAPANDTKRVDIARATAAKAVFSGPLIGVMSENGDSSEAISRAKTITAEIANYILTGSFTESE